jgi:Protein of unknown function (DUF1329)
MNRMNMMVGAALACGAMAAPALGAVTADEAAALKTTLTPSGAEKAANKDGSIPAWSGGWTQSHAGPAGGRRPDPFAGEKPILTITGQNAAQHADKLSAGTLALLKKYPDYKLEVFKTQRTHRLLPELADRTARNAVQTTLVDKSGAVVPTSYAGGAPFPIPKSGEEAMWNHLLRQRGSEDFLLAGRSYLVTAEGKRTLIADIDATVRTPASFPTFKAEGWDGFYSSLRVLTNSPVIRAGEQVIARDNIDESKSEVYAYLPGQRRVRRLPNACCDSPSPVTAGIANVDDTSVWSGRLSTFDWKLAGKKELYIPYNANAFNVPASDADVIGERFLKPEHVRWELHRVWVVEATLKSGQRHTSPKSVYYLDEDTWQAVVADRWDAKGQLWKHSFVLPMVFPDAPMTAGTVFGFYDLLSNTFLVNNVMNEKKGQLVYRKQADDTWLPDSMAGSGVR